MLVSYCIASYYRVIHCMISQLLYYIVLSCNISQRDTCKRHCLVGIVVKASASGLEEPEFDSRLAVGIYPGRVMPVTEKLALQLLPCQAPGVIGSALRLVGQASVYCDWMR